MKSSESLKGKMWLYWVQKQEVQKAMQPDNGKEICQRIGSGAGLFKKKKKKPIQFWMPEDPCSKPED